MSSLSARARSRLSRSRSAVWKIVIRRMPRRTTRRPGEDGAAQNVDVLGMSLGKLDDATRKTFGIAKEVEGVLVTEVQNGSIAANKRIAAGDVIVDIAQETVSTPEDVAARIEKLRDEGRKNALLMLASKTGELRFVTLQMD